MPRSPTLRVEAVTVDRILPIRHEVLRPGRPTHTASFGGDDLASTIHLAAWQGHLVIGCLTLLKRPPPGEPAPPWQLRGMAVRAGAQRQGVGTALLQASTRYTHGAGMWCNARQGAVGFYARHGWRVVSEPFDVPGIGPHRRMHTHEEHA